MVITKGIKIGRALAAALVSLVASVEAKIVTVKAKAVQKQTDKLTSECEKVDEAQELSQKRIKFAYDMCDQLIDRAEDKLAVDLSEINKNKRKMANSIKELRYL